MLATWAFLIGLLAMGDTNTDPETYSMIVPDGPISAPLGASITLPCSVSPAFSVVPHKIRWYRPNKFDTPILLYENRKVQKDPSDAQYRGRVSLVGQLDQGNVSMRLNKLTLADRGEYVCYVHSTVWFEEGTVSVIAEVVGTLPVLSVSSGEEDKVNVTCMSEGWSPQPTLTWTGGGGESITLYHTVYSTDEQGLVRVSSWLLHSPSESEWLSCSVGLSDQDRREGRVVPYVYTTHKGAVIGIVISVVVVLILVPVIVFLYRKGVKVKKQKQEELENKDEEMQMMQGGYQKKLEEEEKQKADFKNKLEKEEKEKQELQIELHGTRSRLLKEKEAHREALARLQEQISDISTSRLGKIEGAVRDLKKKIMGTLSEPEKDQGPLKELLTRLDKVLQKETTRDAAEHQNIHPIKKTRLASWTSFGKTKEGRNPLQNQGDNQTVMELRRNTEELSQKMCEVTRRLEEEIKELQQVLSYRAGHSQRQAVSDKEKEDDTTLPMLQRKLTEISNCASDLEDEVSQIDHQYQIDVTRRLELQNKGLNNDLAKVGDEVKKLDREKEGLETLCTEKTREAETKIKGLQMKLLKEKEVHREALAKLQEQISDISTTRLRKIEGAADELQKKIMGTLSQPEKVTPLDSVDQGPLKELLIGLDTILQKKTMTDTAEHQNIPSVKNYSVHSAPYRKAHLQGHKTLQNQGDNPTLVGLKKNTEELSTKMGEVTRRLDGEIRALKQVLRDGGGCSPTGAVSDEEKEDDTTLPVLQRKLNEINNWVSHLENQVSQIDLRYQMDENRRLKQQNEALQSELSDTKTRLRNSEEMQKKMDEVVPQKHQTEQDGTGGTSTDDQTVSSTQGMQRNMNETIKQEEQDINALQSELSDTKTRLRNSEEMQKKMDEVVPQKHQTEQMQKQMDEVVPQKHQTEQDGTGGTSTDDQTVSSTQANKTRGRDTGMASQQTTSSHRTLYSGYRYSPHY